MPPFSAKMLRSYEIQSKMKAQSPRLTVNSRNRSISESQPDLTIELVKTLNELYSSLSAKRRYEVWFLRIGLADGSGAWWFRYLLMNPGRGGCREIPQVPLQVWASWFPKGGRPQSIIQGFPLESLELSARGQNPFHFQLGDNEIGENFCRGSLAMDGHTISWDLRYRSTFRLTLSNKGWIGFSRTPHSDALFSGRVTLDERIFEGDPLGFGVQGHNCGYRHRTFWRWAHLYFPRTGAAPSTLEALVYEMPFGLVFRRAMLWHDGRAHEFRNLQEVRKPNEFGWKFCCSAKDGYRLEAAVDGSGPSIHRIPYWKTDCTGSFEVANNSLAKAILRLEGPGSRLEILETDIGAVLEMVGL
jgi:hypothetical protein